MEIGRVSELPSKFAVPFVVEGLNKINKMGPPNPLNNAVAGVSIELLSTVYRALNEQDQRRIDQQLSNPIFRNPVKFFDPMTVVETAPTFDFYDPKTNFRLNKGQPYLAIHLGFAEGKPITKKDIDESISRIARYVGYNKNELPGNSVVGITYRKLASAARRYGFVLAETPLPAKITKTATNALKNFAKRGMDVSEIVLCFQSFDDIVKRFAPNTRPLS